MKRLFKFATKKEALILCFSIFLVVLSVAVDLIQPSLMYQVNLLMMPSGNIPDGVDTNEYAINYIKGNFSEMGKWIGIMAGTSLVGVIFNLGALYLSVRICVSICNKIRVTIYTNIQYLSVQDIDKFSTSSLITRVNYDIYQIQQLFIMSTNIAIKLPFYLIGGFVLSLWQALDLKINKGIDEGANFAYCYLMIPVMFLIAFLLVGKSKPHFENVKKYYDETNKVMIENLNGVRIVRAFNLEQNQEERFNETNLNLKKSNTRADVIMGCMMPMMLMLVNVTLNLIIIFAGYASMNLDPNGAFEKAGVLLSSCSTFTQYFFLIIMGFMFTAMAMQFYSKVRVSIKRAHEVLDAKPTIVSKPNAKKIKKNDIEFENVYFRYLKEGENPVLENISFKINEGESLGIIGQTGSGKSTLVSLISRLYDVDKGSVKISGINVKDLDLNNIKDNISIAFQEKILFSGTVRSNIQVAKQDATDEEIIKALKISEAYDFVMEKDGKLDAVVEQKGKNFSGGQKQRLSIARAIVKNPKILIFDDSTSALDNITEKKLLNNIKKELKNTTLVMVAQRVKSIEKMDKIIVLDEGRIVGMGTHKELLKKCKTYKMIYDSQSTSVEG